LEGLLQSTKENVVVLSDTPNTVIVVDHALMPKGAAGPRRSGSIVIAFFMSLGLGVGLSLLLKFMDDAVRTVEDVENAIKLPVIGAIPSSKGSLSIVRFIPLVGKLRTKNRDQGAALIVRHGDPSIQTESYLHMRTSLLLSNAGGPPRRLLITSSQPTEGKTTTAINLATVLAQTGAKVLLIDADLRRPRVHLALDMSNQQGLTTLLAGSNLEESDVLSTIVKCEEAGFFALTSGPTSPNPANLLGSPQMRTLLSTLDSAFDHIIIDSPPAVFFTDSVILSSLVEGVLLVVRSGESTRSVIQRGTKMFRDVGANVIGVVLNDMASSAQDYTHQNYGYRYENHTQASAGDNTLGLT
ncbi:MAG: polysaccharide biosynthesis tyrosine autokinase, partial [Candidatus Udaeobacter sp.]